MLQFLWIIFFATFLFSHISDIKLSNCRHLKIHWFFLIFPDFFSYKPFVNSVIKLFSNEIDSRLIKYSNGFDGSVLIRLSSKLMETTFESPEILENEQSNRFVIIVNLLSAYFGNKWIDMLLKNAWIMRFSVVGHSKSSKLISRWWFL